MNSIKALAWTVIIGSIVLVISVVTKILPYLLGAVALYYVLKGLYSLKD